jgi:hypothetical protein
MPSSFENTYNNLMLSAVDSQTGYILDAGLQDTKNCCITLDYTTAAKNNHVRCLEKKCDDLVKVPWNAKTIEIAAENGSIDCLKYLYENDCPVNNDICDYTAEGGYIDCLRYLHVNGIPLTTETCYYAAYNGYKECLEYMMQNGCVWSDLIFQAVIKSQDLDIFVYALESGYVFSSRILDLLIKEGSKDVLTYFFNNIGTRFSCYIDLVFSMFFEENAPQYFKCQN